MSERSTEQEESAEVRLEIRLLGPLELVYGQHALPRFPTRSAQLLFSFLVINRTRRYVRQLLSGTIWGECSEEEARRKLRMELHRVRRTLVSAGEDVSALLLVDQRSVGFNVKGSYWLDIEEFEKRVLATESGDFEPTAPELGCLLREALSLYRGELLEGEYDPWCLAEQDRLKALKLRAEERLFHHYLHCHDWPRARVCGSELVRLNPLREHLHRELMILHYLNGDRPLALRQYLECCEVLDRELSVPPMRRTVDLNDALRAEDTKRVAKLIELDPVPGSLGQALTGRTAERAEAVQAVHKEDTVAHLQQAADALMMARENLLRGIRGLRPRRQHKGQGGVQG